MANLVEYVKTVWENGKTALNAARMNNMEQGISDCATQINKLGDSVSRCTTFDKAGADSISFAWATFSTGENRLQVRVNNTLVLSLKADFPDE